MPTDAFLPLGEEQASMLARNPNPVLVLDAQCRIRYVNPASAAYGDVDPATLVGAHVWTLYPALKGSIFEQAYEGVLREGVPKRFEDRDFDKERWASVYAYPADGGVVAILEDVTSQRESARALMASEEALARAQSLASIGSWTYTPANGLQLSAEAYRLLGLDPTDERADFVAIREHLNTTHRTRLSTAMMQAAEGEDVRQTVEYRRFDGQPIWLDVLMRITQRSGTGPVEVHGTIQDVTARVKAAEERQRIESQIQQAQKLESLGILAGGIAHDFNNLLVGILGNVSLAMMDLDPAHAAHASLAEIERAAQRAADLTRQLLAYAGKGRFVVEPLDAAMVLREMTPLLQSAISRRASLQLDLATEPTSIAADATQFRQVVMNVVTNASDALGEQGGLIRVRTDVCDVDDHMLRQCVPGSTARPGGHLIVEVSDTGMGMDADLAARVFDPFFSTKFTGRGLGLAATLGIMHSHSGAIRVASAVGAGTTFTLFFPLADGTPKPTPPSVPAVSRCSGHALVVDDEDGVRAVTAELLRRRGFTTQEAADGISAVTMFREDPSRYRLVVLDLTMPGMDGHATLRALRALRADIPVVLMSGFIDHDGSKLAGDETPTAFVQKPFRVQELMERVEGVLHRET